MWIPREAKPAGREVFRSAAKAGPLPPLIHTVEPPQPGPKRAEVESPTQPLLFIGYKRPEQYDKDDPVFDVIAGLLASGRTGLLYRDMVRDKTHFPGRHRRLRFPGRPLPQPVPLLPGACSRPHGGRKPEGVLRPAGAL